MSDPALPLCVDLDETLVRDDTVFLSVQIALAGRPWRAPVLLWQLLKGGRPAAKAWMAKVAPIEAATLPYRESLIAYLRVEKSKGRKLYLISAASQNTADRVASHLKIFDGAFGSSATQNLKGAAKATFIREKISPRFAYAGDSFADLAVWKEAEEIILCGPKAKLIRRALNRAAVAVFD